MSVVCTKAFAITIGASPHGPPTGPIQIDAASIATINGYMDFLFACNGLPPVHYFTGLLIWNGITWVETESVLNFIVLTPGAGISVQIDIGNGSGYFIGATVAPDPVGVVTWFSGGALLTVCGPVPGIPPAPGSTSWA